jgi:hypothetical protein
MLGEGLWICIHHAIFPLDSGTYHLSLVFLLTFDIILFNVVDSTYGISWIIYPAITDLTYLKSTMLAMLSILISLGNNPRLHMYPYN